MSRRFLASSFVALMALVVGATDLSAQPLGTFRWRTEPYCNVITVTVTPVGGVYTLDGFDEQCGGSPRQPVRGVALPQANGSITIGVSVVMLPGGTPVNIEAGISQSSLSGTWRDSAGNSGPFTFSPTATDGGPRPGPVPPSSIPSTFVLQPQGGFAVTADPAQSAAIPASGAGRRLLWHAGKGAFRSGIVNGSQWDDANVGAHSTAFGVNTMASGTASFAAGFRAVASAPNSIALGQDTVASGSGGVALGTGAVAPRGAFTFADESVFVPFYSRPNEFNVRASGGAGFSSNSALTAGVELKPGASAWSSVSDVNRKENFRELDGGDLLAKLANMSIREWNYKAQDASIRHVGPTAQDFHAAFGLGEDSLRISTIDADGIALAAVKALEARTREENVALKAQVEALLARLDQLEAQKR